MKTLFTAPEINLFKRVKDSVVNLPDLDLGISEGGLRIVLSCHILGRAVAAVFNLVFADGYFYPNFLHTWLLTPALNIIDVCPIMALGGPILISGRKESPAKQLYLPKQTWEISCGRFEKPSFCRAVGQVVDALSCRSNK